MNQQTAFAVPKERQDVTVHLQGGRKADGAIFLEAALEGTSLHHKVVSFLEDEKSFFPLVMKGGGTEFIQKKNIRWVELDCRPDLERINAALGLMQTIEMTTVLTDEAVIKGLLIAEVPAEKARLSDCLNLPHRFLHVKVDARICYINKHAVQKVTGGPKKPA